jgi:hypothetical protein
MNVMTKTISTQNPRAIIGGNNPPEETPIDVAVDANAAVAIGLLTAPIDPFAAAFDAVRVNIVDLYEEAKLWLDGTPVEHQDQADAINTLKSAIKAATAAAEDIRVKEITPHQDTVKEIQARYNELIGNNKTVVGIAIRAEKACNDALRPYLLELDRQQQETARLAREEADRLHNEAMEAMRQRDPANLAQREEAETLVQVARQASTTATRAENSKAHAKGQERATSLRTIRTPQLVDAKLAAAWVWKERNEDLMAFILELATKEVRSASGKREIPGFTIVEEKVL